LRPWLARVARRLWRLAAGRAGPGTDGRRTEVEFYRRMETLLARQGLVRAAGQTQREFALDAGRQIAARCGRQRLTPLPGRVAEAFYRVRFGRLPLDRSMTQEVERALEEMADDHATHDVTGGSDP
jgi:hypothetical protein